MGFDQAMMGSVNALDQYVDCGYPGNIFLMHVGV